MELYFSFDANQKNIQLFYEMEQIIAKLVKFFLNRIGSVFSLKP